MTPTSYKRNPATRNSHAGLALALGLTLALYMGCSDDTAATPPAKDGAVADGTTSKDTATADGTTAKGTWIVLVRGALATTDMAAAKKSHDAIAKGGETAAKAAGDTAHDVLLGTKMLGTTENQFLGLDQWNNLTGMQKFYSDPTFAKEFAKLFSGTPPTPETFVMQPTWHSWGSMKSGDSHTPYYFVVARGKLKESDAAKAKKAHDAVASGGETVVKAAGDVAHIVFTGLADPRQFLAIDIWKDSSKLAGVYSDPNFVKGFASLFEGTPSVAVYKSTDWHQW
jgi:hypothetical protein